ncbi:MAG TPA: FIST N-terminal domain-containing protein [Polyangia bacterium]|jgi:hypothetical protein|nr:FIST N-terminal domain-containing protein [Polyangia bacterium]
MQTAQTQWLPQSGWRPADSSGATWKPDLAFAFGSRRVLTNAACMEALREAFPGVTLIGCSTAGEICGTTVQDDTLSVTAVRFDHTQVRFAREIVPDRSKTRPAARAIAEALDHEQLVSVFVLSDGLTVHGPDLIAGIADALPPEVVVTGGMAADASEFCETVVLSEHGVERNTILAVGFYGARLKVGHGSLGGWDPFGPFRRVTRASGQVLHELDGKSALALYKQYLGEHAAALPGSCLFFPLSVSRTRDEPGVVRTVLAIDEQAGTMIFGGDIPEGGYAQLMRANVDRLVDGALGAARATHEGGAPHPNLALLISCSGRRLVLRQRVEEEIEAVREVLGPGTTLSGFYSYGELAPSARGASCELHNQTMTLVTLAEV